MTLSGQGIDMTASVGDLLHTPQVSRPATSFESIVDYLDDAVMLLDHTAHIVQANPAALHILGLHNHTELSEYAAGIRQLPVFDEHGTLLSHDYRQLLGNIVHGKPVKRRILGIDRADGQRIWLCVNCRQLPATEGGDAQVVISFSDITKDHDAAVMLAYQATHDSLTGLPNRAALMDNLHQLHSDNALAALFFLDFNGFKAINDTYGHDAGDTVINIAAQRLRHSVRSNDIVHRLAGDEFVVLLPGDRDHLDLDGIVERIHTVLGEPIALANTMVNISAAIGVVDIHHDDIRDPHILLRDADHAMYTAKATQKAADRFAAAPQDIPATPQNVPVRLPLPRRKTCGSGQPRPEHYNNPAVLDDIR